MRRHLQRATAALMLAALAGCASVQGPADPRDPFEGFNRSVYRFNDAFDRAIAKPVAQGYQKVVPSPVRTGIGNFFSNLGDVVVFLNELLQFKLKNALSDLGRIAFNTTAGLGGLIDVATPMDFPKHDEDFGQTLGYWGIGPGPYLVLPFVGPSTVRDGTGRIADGYVYPPYQVKDTTTRWELIGVESVDTRAKLLGASNVLEQAALDPYAFMRDYYLQRRENQVYDGHPPNQSLDFEPFGDDPGDPLPPDDPAGSGK